MENMYTGKSSRNPNMPIIIGGLLGIALISFGIYLYIDLAAWEQSNEEMQLNSFLWFLYDMGGKLAVAGFFGICGTAITWSGAKNTVHLRKLKKGSKRS